MKNSKKKQDDRELVEWLQQTVRKLRGSALPLERSEEDPFSDPTVRRRTAELISRSIESRK